MKSSHHNHEMFVFARLVPMLHFEFLISYLINCDNREMLVEIGRQAVSHDCLKGVAVVCHLINAYW
jgi:hypothetical protein